MTSYETEWIAGERVCRARAEAAREAMIRKAFGDNPRLRTKLGALLIRLGTWLRDGSAQSDVEAKRAAA